MAFTPEQLMTPLGQLATAIYSPDTPNPKGVAVLQAIIGNAMTRCITNPLQIVTQTSDWTSFSDNTINGATFWTIGAGVIIGDLIVTKTGELIISNVVDDNTAASLKVFQDPNWIPDVNIDSGQGSIACQFKVYDLQACKAIIESDSIL